jgi:outer membrane protein TolC
LTRLPEEFINKTQEYKASLTKLMSLLERDIQRAEEKLTTTKNLFSEGVVGASQVLEAERAVQAAKDKARCAETRR